MKQISNALLLAQQNDDRTPYVRVYLNSVEYTTANRVLAVVEWQTPYTDGADILLDNSDQNFKTSDLIGYEVNIGWGMTNAYVNSPDLYVTKQEDISINGKLYTRLTCMGNWGRLEKHKVMGDAVGAAPSSLTQTVKEIIQARIFDTMTLDVNTSDGTEESKVPELVVDVWASRASMIKMANDLTKNLLYMRDGDLIMIDRNSSQQHRLTGTLTGELTLDETVTGSASSATGKVVYQSVASGAGYLVIEAETGTWQTAENTAGASYACNSITAIDEYDYLYELDGTHTFFEHVRTQNLLRANRVICVDKLPDSSGTLHTYTNVANDTADQAVFGITTYIFEDSSVTSDAEALISAQAILSSLQAEAQGGFLIAPMNCATEMYDVVRITDVRGGWTSGDVLGVRVGGITRRYEPGVYNIELTFGGLVMRRPELLPVEDIVVEEIEEEMAPVPPFGGWPIYVPPQDDGGGGGGGRLPSLVPPIAAKAPPSGLTPHPQPVLNPEWAMQQYPYSITSPLPQGIPGYGQAPTTVPTTRQPVSPPQEGFNWGKIGAWSAAAATAVFGGGWLKGLLSGLGTPVPVTVTPSIPWWTPFMETIKTIMGTGGGDTEGKA